MRSHAVLIIASVFISLSLAESARACSCGGSDPCQVFRSVDAVFIGKVTMVSAAPAEKIATEFGEISLVDPDAIAHFQIEKTYKGLPVAQKTVAVRTSTGCCACGVGFKVGETYLVNAYRDKNGDLGTSYCSRTKTLADAKHDITLMESFIAGKGLTAILGSVGISTSSQPGDWLEDSAGEGLELEIRGSGRSFRATADSNGQFRVWNVPEGSYVVRPILNSAYEKFSAERVSIRGEACSADAYVFLNAIGVVRGRILDSRGKPVESGTQVLVLYADGGVRKTAVMSTQTKADGSYEFGSLAPGRYILAVDNNFYGGGTDRSKARIIDLMSKTRAVGIDIRLPK